MDKSEWFELVKQAELVRHVIGFDDAQMIADEILNLINLLYCKVEDIAEHDGWYVELENFIDAITFETKE